MPLSSVHLVPSGWYLSVLGSENGLMKSCCIFKLWPSSWATVWKYQNLYTCSNLDIKWITKYPCNIQITKISTRIHVDRSSYWILVIIIVYFFTIQLSQMTIASCSQFSYSCCKTFTSWWVFKSEKSIKMWFGIQYCKMSVNQARNYGAIKRIQNLSLLNICLFLVFI